MISVRFFIFNRQNGLKGLLRKKEWISNKKEKNEIVNA